MNLQCRVECANSYKSGSQIARILSEEWCSRELYCPACASGKLVSSPVNTPAIDFVCDVCGQPFQLKSRQKWNVHKIVDAGYEAMIRAIRSDSAPNLLVLQYSRLWLVDNLTVIPKFFFTESVVEKRAPLSEKARRAGWVGCNILLGQIPEDGKIAIVSDGIAAPIKQVRAEFARLRSLTALPPLARGWTLDVLNVVRKLELQHFSLPQIYLFEGDLKALHPHNQNIRPKIRQQLQVLRDLGVLRFTSPGHYEVVKFDASI